MTFVLELVKLFQQRLTGQSVRLGQRLESAAKVLLCWIDGTMSSRSAQQGAKGLRGSACEYDNILLYFEVARKAGTGWWATGNRIGLDWNVLLFGGEPREENIERFLKLRWLLFRQTLSRPISPHPCRNISTSQHSTSIIVYFHRIVNTQELGIPQA